MQNFQPENPSYQQEMPQHQQGNLNGHSRLPRSQAHNLKTVLTIIIAVLIIYIIYKYYYKKPSYGKQKKQHKKKEDDVVNSDDRGNVDQDAQCGIRDVELSYLIDSINKKQNESKAHAR